MKSKISTNSLKKLKSNLPKGGLTTIAERLKVSPSLVSRVLNGEMVNVEIIEEALLLVAESKARHDELEKRINALI